MGHKNSKAYSEAIKKLSSLELKNIKAVFNELSTENKDGTREIPEPNLATRRVFAERFSLPGLIGERLFHAFDRDNNGTINLEEFLGGVALCLHGSVQAKCELLFRVFNFSDDDDAVTEDELKTILLSSLQSAHTILDSVQDGGIAEMNQNGKPLMATVAEIVQDAFRTGDKSKTGKLSAKEFSTWLHKNPQIMDNVFGWQCPKPELGQWANEPESQEMLADQESGKSLQDLFGGQGGQDIAGESFFDSLGTSSDLVSVQDTIVKGDFEKLENNPSVKHDELDEKVVINYGGSSEQERNVTCLIPEPSLVPQPSTPVQSIHSHNTEPSIPDTSHYAPLDNLDSLWLPSADTSSFLRAIKNGTLEPENVELSNQAIPCLAIDVPQVDPVKELIKKFSGSGESPKRSVPTTDTVSCDESGLKVLLEAECWRSALDLTAKLLENYGQGQGNNVSQVIHSPSSLQIWFCRIALLFQLKMFSIAEVELEAFGNLDSAKLYYEFYPTIYPGKQGSMVPFCFRILHAMLPQYTGRPEETLEKLFYIHKVCQEILKNLSDGKCEGIGKDVDEGCWKKGVQLWERRLIQVLYCIGNTFVLTKEYSLAMQVFRQVLKKDTNNSRALLSGIGRISLQSGDIERAQLCFKQVEEMDPLCSTPQSDVLVNRGLLALALDAYEEAYKHFLAAKNIDPENYLAVNNAAVSLLFQGRLKEALELLEGVVLKHPKKTLQDGVLFNICTMYELETSHHLQKKQKLLGLISKYKGDGFNTSSLKFP